MYYDLKEERTKRLILCDSKFYIDFSKIEIGIPPVNYFFCYSMFGLCGDVLTSYFFNSERKHVKISDPFIYQDDVSDPLCIDYILKKYPESVTFYGA